ncbi:MAG: hypothetical protein ACRDYV_14245 [Acidimicrobiia bacterium]
MARMGHSSTRAALIYHASRDRERAIAAAVSARVEAARPERQGARRGHGPRIGPEATNGPETAKAPLTCGRGAWSG